MSNSYFRDAVVSLDQAVEIPEVAGMRFKHVMNFWLTGKEGSSVDHVINKAGIASTKANRELRLEFYAPGASQ
jgi:hypothetical protein